MGQIEEELDFKSLLGKVICFVHRYFTKTVEKTQWLIDFVDKYAPGVWSMIWRSGKSRESWGSE